MRNNFTKPTFKNIMKTEKEKEATRAKNPDIRKNDSG
jgi:hypothetical protein